MAASIMSKCPFTQPDDICRWLRDQIHKKVLQQKSESGVRGLRERILDQIYGANGPTLPDGSVNPVWKTHDDEIRKLRENINEYLEEHNDRDCGDKIPVSKEVKNWVRTTPPRPQDWKGPRPAESTHFSPLSWDDWKRITGLSGMALAAYLLFSEGSRIVFPPRNAIPVP